MEHSRFKCAPEIEIWSAEHSLQTILHLNFNLLCLKIEEFFLQVLYERILVSLIEESKNRTGTISNHGENVVTRVRSSFFKSLFVTRQQWITTRNQGPLLDFFQLCTFVMHLLRCCCSRYKV